MHIPEFRQSITKYVERDCRSIRTMLYSNQLYDLTKRSNDRMRSKN